MNLLKALSAHGAGDQFVTSLTFASGGFPKAELFEITEPGEREVPKVAF